MTEPTPTTANDRTAPADLPGWLVAVVVVLCLAGGGGLVWWYFSAPPRMVAMPTPTAGTAANRPARQRPARDAPPPQQADWNDDVRPAANNGFQVRAGDVQMRVRQRDGEAEPSLFPFYRSPLLPPEQLTLLRAPLLAAQEERAKRLNLTPEQVESLKAISPFRGMKTSAEDQAALKLAWSAFEAAPPDAKPAAKAALLAKLAELGNKNRDATRTSVAEAAVSIQKILTPEQQAMIANGQF